MIRACIERRARRIAASAIVGAILTAGAGWSVPTRAAAVTTTTIAATLDGSVTLPLYPCLLVGGCGGGTFDAQAVVKVTGLDVNDVPYVAIWPDPTAVGSLLSPDLSIPSLSYQDQCSTLPYPLTENASGGFTLSDGLLIDPGVSLLPISGATMTGVISWLRAGPALAMGIRATQIAVGSSVLASGAHLADGAGVGAFLPGGGLGGTCSAPQSNQTVTVAGVELLGA